MRGAKLSTDADLIRAVLKSAFGDCDSPIEILTRSVARSANLPSTLVQVYMALADAYCSRAAISAHSNSPQAAAADLEQAETAAASRRVGAACSALTNEAEKRRPRPPN